MFLRIFIQLLRSRCSYAVTDLSLGRHLITPECPVVAARQDNNSQCMSLRNDLCIGRRGCTSGASVSMRLHVIMCDHGWSLRGSWLLPAGMQTAGMYLLLLNISGVHSPISVCHHGHHRGQLSGGDARVPAVPARQPPLGLAAAARYLLSMTCICTCCRREMIQSPTGGTTSKLHDECAAAAQSVFFIFRPAAAILTTCSDSIHRLAMHAGKKVEIANATISAEGFATRVLPMVRHSP